MPVASSDSLVRRAAVNRSLGWFSSCAAIIACWLCACLVEATDTPPVIATPAIADPSQVLGKTTALSVLGADDGGAAALTYTWSVISTTPPPATVTFSANGTNAARATTATFTAPGSFLFQVVVKDAAGHQVSTTVAATVVSTATSLALSPATAKVTVGATRQFTAIASDQFGVPLATQPGASYSTNGGGSMNGSGLFTAGNVPGGPYVVTSTEGALSATAAVTVVPAGVFPLKVNYQPTASAVPAGYQPDDGSLFADRGNGWSYGWNVLHTDATRVRGLNADARLDTQVLMHAAAKWELAVPNGVYSVLVSVGDPSSASTHTINVEGVSYWNAVALATNQFASLTKSVTVTDGRLTVDNGAAADKASRPDYIEISQVNTAPVLAMAATAYPSTGISSRTAVLAMLANDDGGDANLTYTWSTTSAPAAVQFSPNAAATAARTTATFTVPGTYVIQGVAKDANGLSVATTVTVTVYQGLESIVITPATAQVAPGATVQLTASLRDQFGAPLASQYQPTWSVTAGGTISSTGLFTAGAATAASVVVTASSRVTGTATIGVGVTPGVRVNFQTAAAGAPPGYLVDSGATYADRGNGSSYGWTASETTAVFVRGVNPDPRLDSVVSFHAGAKWELGVPNGTYVVTASVGDAGAASVNTLNVEGVAMWTATSLAANQFSRMTKTVTVTDGRLTLDQGAAAEGATRLDYVEVLPSTANAAPTLASGPTVVIDSTLTTATIDLLGADDGGEAALVYTWSLLQSPSGATLSMGTSNGVNAAKHAYMYLNRVGTYLYACQIRDAAGQTALAYVPVVVTARAGSISLSPTNIEIAPGAVVRFLAAATNQFGEVFTGPLTWTQSGGGTVSANGLFTAGATSGPANTITATAPTATGTARYAVATAPTAAALAVTTTTGVPVPLTLLGASATGTISYSYVSPQHGQLAGTPPNLAYKPAVGYIGSDAFTYSASDGFVSSSSATVSITVGAAPTTDRSLSPLVRGTTFDATRWAGDAAYRTAYVATIEPGRIWQSADPGASVPAIRAQGSRNRIVHGAGSSTSLAVVAAPASPVTFTVLGEGYFYDNSQNSLTVLADAYGNASGTLMTPTSGQTAVLVSSPLASGIVRFNVDVVIP